MVLVMPATNATSERSFSAFRPIKTYFRSLMLQERLNHLMLLHIHIYIYIYIYIYIWFILYYIVIL